VKRRPYELHLDHEIGSLQKIYICFSVLIVYEAESVLSRIRIRNFRCLRDVSLDLAPLTFIVGPNGSGKSSVLLGIQLLKQSIGRRVAFNGEFVELGSFQDVLYSGQTSDTPLEEGHSSITLEVAVKPSKSELDIITQLLDPIFREKPSKIEELGYEVSFDEEQIQQSYLVNDQKIFTFGFFKIGPGSFQSRIRFPQRLENVGCSGSESILNPDSISIAHAPNADIPPGQVNKFQSLIRRISRIIERNIESTYYISVLRQPRITRTSGGYFPTWVGRNGEHTVGLLALIFGSREYEHAKNRIFEWASVFGLEDLKAGWRGREELSADFRDPNTHSTLKVTAAGYGSIQILPIITQLFWSSQGSTISFEEPEMSLHLELIGKLPKMLSEVVNEDKQLIITTHEQNILFALKAIISKKELPYEKVAVYELKGAKHGSEAKRLEVTPEGIVKGGISSFIEAQRNLMYEWTLTIPSAGDEKHSEA